MTTLAEAILKNIDTTDGDAGLAVAAVIMREANRRPHFAGGGVQGAGWDRHRGIGVQVQDEGQMIHLANALSLHVETEKVKGYNSGQPGIGWGRKGSFAGFDVTIWYIEI